MGLIVNFTRRPSAGLVGAMDNYINFPSRGLFLTSSMLCMEFVVSD